MPSKIQVLDHMRQTARLTHMRLRTEEASVQWARRCMLFHQKRHPADMGPAAIRAFLTPLAVAGQVAASTQHVALQALLLLSRDVVKQSVPALGEIARAKRFRRVPVVCSQDAVHRLLAHMEGIPQLMAGLLAYRKFKRPFPPTALPHLGRPVALPLVPALASAHTPSAVRPGERTARA